ncbi:MAG: tetratricopeptide repeat protein [Spirochaetia bacterium]|nr:tetratricopeptide repeat protein [Spirochaetia bacterium]
MSKLHQKKIIHISLLFIFFTINPLNLFSKDAADQDEVSTPAQQEPPEYILNMAFHYYNDYDYDKAIVYFEKYLKVAGEEEVSLTHLGKIYLNLKNNEKALSYFQRADKLHPKNIDTLTSIAEIYLTNKDDNSAIKILESIEDLDPVNERALFTLAEIYNIKKDKRKSMVYYKKLSMATLKNSANIRLLNKSYTNIAHYYYDIQDYEKALEYYEKIIEISPEDFNSAYVYAELLKVNGKFGKSSEVMIQLLKKDPGNIEVLESLIESLFIINDYQTRAFLKTYKDNKQKINSLYSGIDQLFSGDLNSANANFNHVLKKNPNRISAHIGLLNSIPKENLEERKKEAYTIAILAQKIRSYDLAAFFMDQVFQILDQEKKETNFQNKLEHSDKAIPLNHDEEKLLNEYIDSYYTHAISMENLNYSKQALAYYVQCLHLINDQLAILEKQYKPEEYLHFESKLFKSENTELNRDKEKTLYKIKSLREKKYEALLNYNWLANKLKKDTDKSLIENIEINDQDPRAYFINGLITYENAKDDLKQYEKAKDSLLNSVSLYEKNSEKKIAPPNYYFYLGIAYDKLNDFNQMEVLLKKAIELDPYNPVYLNYLGYMYSLKNINLESAYEYIKRGLEDDPENDAYLDTLGWIYYKMNKFEEALGQLLVARTLSEKKGRKDPVIDFHIAETYYKTNNTNQAIRFYKLSLEHYEHSSEPLDKKYIESQVKTLSSPAVK